MSKQVLKQVSPHTSVWVDEEDETMSNKKQSSVEWFAMMLAEQGLLVTNDYENLVTYKEAKAMHKEEQVNTFRHAQALMVTDSSKRAEHYYNETFGGQDNE